MFCAALHLFGSRSYASFLCYSSDLLHSEIVEDSMGIKHRRCVFHHSVNKWSKSPHVTSSLLFDYLQLLKYIFLSKMTFVLTRYKGLDDVTETSKTHKMQHIKFQNTTKSW
jgi:hypothetical protein